MRLTLCLALALALSACGGGTSTPPAATPATASPAATPAAATAAATPASLPLEAIGNLLSGVNAVTREQLPEGLPLARDGALWLHGIAAGFNPDDRCEPLLVLANGRAAALPEIVIEYTVRDTAGTVFTPDSGSLVKPLAAGSAHNVLGRQMATGCSAVSIAVQRVSCRDDQALPTACPFTTLASANHGLAGLMLPP